MSFDLVAVLKVSSGKANSPTPVRIPSCSKGKCYSRSVTWDEQSEQVEGIPAGDP